jgi:hypothetical protein
MAQFAGDLTVRRGHGSCFRAPVLPATANAISCGVLRLDNARHCADPFRSIATVENLLPLEPILHKPLHGLGETSFEGFFRSPAEFTF